MQIFSQVVTSTTVEQTQVEPLIDLARQYQFSLKTQYRASYPTVFLTIPEILTRRSPNDCSWIPLVKKISKSKAPQFIVQNPEICKNVKAFQTKGGMCALYVTTCNIEEFKFDACFQKTNIEGADKSVVSKCPIFRLRSFDLHQNREFDPFIYAQIPKGKSGNVAIQVNQTISNFFNLPQTQGESKEDYKVRIRNVLNRFPSMTDLTPFFYRYYEIENYLYCQDLSRKRRAEELYPSEEETLLSEEVFDLEEVLSVEPQRKKARVEDDYGDLLYALNHRAIGNENIDSDLVGLEWLSPEIIEILNSTGDDVAEQNREKTYEKSSNDLLDDQDLSQFCPSLFD